MSAIIPHVGEINLLSQILAGPGQTWWLRLFSSVAGGLNPGTKAGDFTECTFNGYKPQTIQGWGTVALDNTGRAFAMAKTASFQRVRGGAGGSVLGYYVTDQTKALLYWAELDPNGAFSMDAPGALYLVIPRLALLSQY